MNYYGPKLSFGKIISHVFPGFIFLVELVVLFYLVSGVGLNNAFDQFKVLNWNTQIFIFFFFIFVGTICGVIIDAIHHFIFDETIDRIKKIIGKKSRSFQEDSDESFVKCFSLLTKDQADIYKDYVDEEYLYYYESYINTFIALIPLFFIFKMLSVSMLWWVILSVIMCILFIEAQITRDEFYETHEKIMKYFNEKNK